MKNTIRTLLVACMSFAAISCSVQEDMTTTEQDAVSVGEEGKKMFTDEEFSKAIAEGIAAGLKDFKIDFVTLFKYGNESELKSKSERLFRFSLQDMPYEMAQVKDAAYMVITVDVANGRAATTGIYYLNAQKDTALQHSIPTPENEYKVEYNVPFQTEAMGYTLVKDGINPNDAAILSDYLLAKAKTQGTGSFMAISTEDKVSLYLKS
ncbi:hypothetical protein ACX0HA_11380 [Flavobacterium hauense]